MTMWLLLLTQKVVEMNEMLSDPSSHSCAETQSMFLKLTSRIKEFIHVHMD